LQRPPIAEEIARSDREFVLKKLGLTEGEYAKVLAAPPKTYWDFESDEKFFPDKAYHWSLHNLDLFRHPVKTLSGWAWDDVKRRWEILCGWFADAGDWLQEKRKFVWMWVLILVKLPFRLAWRLWKRASAKLKA
jgi:hypothetical protein